MKTVKVLVAASMAAALLAGCGSKTDTDTFRFASEDFGVRSRKSMPPSRWR